MTREDIFAKVRDVLVDALAVDDDEVRLEASLVADLGAESIDFMDIVFQLEKTFSVKIGQGELFPEGANITQDRRYVQGGKITTEGIDLLKTKLPHVDFSNFAKDPQVGKIINIFTVQTIVNFMARKLNVA